MHTNVLYYDKQSTIAYCYTTQIWLHHSQIHTRGRVNATPSEPILEIDSPIRQITVTLSFFKKLHYMTLSNWF